VGGMSAGNEAAAEEYTAGQEPNFWAEQVVLTLFTKTETVERRGRKSSETRQKGRTSLWTMHQRSCIT
jgi:hypothetical protein